jgi:hypothetical protein
MTNSNFSARADQAALALKAQLSAKLGREIAPRSVPVGPNGQPVPPLPPEGSYARQAVERQRAAAAAARAQSNPQAPEAQPQLPTQQDQPAGPEGGPQAGQQPPAQDQLTPNAQQRFSQLTGDLRRKDQELQQERARRAQLEQEAQQARAQREEAERRYAALVNQNLDSMDEDTRNEVLRQASLNEAAAQIEQRILQRVAPTIERVHEQSIQAELVAVSEKYPAFSPDVHGPLIEIFRQKNPNCTIEQAFRAVAEPEELATSRQASAPAVPPIAIPQSVNASPRYIPPPPKPQITPDQELDALRERAYKLAQSTNPKDRRHANMAMENLIRAKMSGRLPGQR